jgi:hypothetical protein
LLGIAVALAAHVVRCFNSPHLRRRSSTHTFTPWKFALPIELTRMAAANGVADGPRSGVGEDGHQLRGERRGRFLRSDLLDESRHIVGRLQLSEGCNYLNSGLETHIMVADTSDMRVMVIDTHC